MGMRSDVMLTAELVHTGGDTSQDRLKNAEMILLLRYRSP